jgi:hypothetical protein
MQTTARKHRLKNNVLKNEPPNNRPPDFVSSYGTPKHRPLIAVRRSQQPLAMLTIPRFASSFGALKQATP